MKTRALWAAACVVAVGLALLLLRDSPDATPPAVAPPSEEVGVTTERRRVRAEVEAELDDWRSIWSEQARTSEEAAALVQRRRAADEATIAELSSVGSTSAIVEAYVATEASREKLLLIDSLSEIHTPEALEALRGVYTDDGSLFRLREEALRGIGGSKADGAAELLLDTMTDAEDYRFGQIAAQSLYGRAEALDGLMGVIRSDAHMNIRLEAVHSIGGIGSEVARAALEEILAGDLEPRVRVYAEKEIERSFG